MAVWNLRSVKYKWAGSREISDRALSNSTSPSVQTGRLEMRCLRSWAKDRLSKSFFTLFSASPFLEIACRSLSQLWANFDSQSNDIYCKAFYNCEKSWIMFPNTFTEGFVGWSAGNLLLSTLSHQINMNFLYFFSRDPCKGRRTGSCKWEFCIHKISC